MSKTHEGSPSRVGVENNPKKPSALRRMGRAVAKAAGAVRDIVRTAKNRNGFAERLGINTENKNGLAAGVDVDSAAAEAVLSSDSSTESGEKDSREGSSNGLTPKQIEALRRDARVVVISNPEKQISNNTEDASGSSAEKNIPVSEPPEPTPDELDRIKWNDYMRDAAAKRFVLVHPTTEEDLRKLESFGVDIDSSSVKPSTPEEQASDSTEDASGSSAEKNIPVSEPPEPSLPKSVTTPDGRRHPFYPKPSLPKSVTKPDGRQYPAEIKPPKPTPLDILIDKRKGEAVAAAAAAKYSSSVNPDVYTRVKGENVIDKDMFSTTIPNVDKPKKDDNPEGLTPYEQAMRYKYLGDEYDEAEYGDDEPEKIQETYEAATNLKIARSRFAKASVAVESHFFKKFFGGKKRQAELEAATEQLKQCELEYMSLKFADKIEAAKQDPEKQAELAAEMAQAAFASMQETSRTTTDKYDSMLDDRGKFKKAVAKVGKWFNKGGKIAQWLKLGGAGFVGGAIVGSVATWPITTAVGIVTGLGVAGATKQAVLEEHRGEDRIDADASLGTIDPSFKDTVAKMKIDDVMEHAVNVSVDNLKDVSIERQDDLRKRMRWAMGRFSIGFALGGYAGKFVGDWANSAHATGDSASQSGGKELKTHLLEKVKDAAPGSADPVGNYTPGLDSLYGYDPSKHEFLWQWAESVYGEGNGTSGIMHTVDVLRNNGYIVDIINNPNGSFSVVVDGVSDTEGLVKIFSQFVN